MKFKHFLPTAASVFLFGLTVFVASCGSSEGDNVSPSGSGLTETKTQIPYDLLTSYNFFSGKISDLNPGENVLPYDLINSLFTDYAKKSRFIYLPEGKKIDFTEKEVLEFPVGTVLIKHFYYDNDFNNPSAGRKIIETRLLVHNPGGWEAFPYVWNDEQTEAELKILGGAKSVSWKHSDGQIKNVEYLIPDKNQCNRCHVFGRDFSPIGPKARNMNKDYAYSNGTENQLVRMQKMGWLDGMPDISKVEKMVHWENKSEDLELRVRSYLDANCSHCHRDNAAANNSGLFLGYYEREDIRIGICKQPVAAGQASGNLKHVVSPGNPEESILTYRMESNRPGTMMPEIGRTIVHEEGVALIKEWILSLEGRGVCSGG